MLELYYKVNKDEMDFSRIPDCRLGGGSSIPGGAVL